MSNNVEKMIEDLQNRVKALEEQLIHCDNAAKPKQWSPVGGDWHIDANGNFRKAVSTKNCKEFGTERQTQKQAERAAVEMRRFNRLLALRDELCGDDVVDWSNTNEKYAVYFNAIENQWWLAIYSVNFITPFFTTLEHAMRACEMLNSGEVEL